MGDWIDAARAALAHGPAALVTVLATEGSVPRGPGTRMLVTADMSHGTIGGGALEFRVAEQARAILDLAPGSWRVQDYPLGPLLGQCCGGRVRLLVERLSSAAVDALAMGSCTATLMPDRVERGAAPVAEVAPLLARGPLPAPGAMFIEPDDRPRRPLLLFGAGHVGRAIASRLPGLPLQLAWFDSRAEMAETPGVMLESEGAMVDCASEAMRETAVLILTHDHALDYRLTAAALSGEAGFVGLIGSRTKRARFLSRLADDGVDSARLICPIGLPGIVGKEPAVIAIAALAQLLSLGPAQ
jgi:xanthine dehydrogenase accessory factor